MPKQNRYKLLCEAYDRGVEECNQYRKECREFVHELRNSIIESLSCLETKLFMYQPSTGFLYKPQMLQGDALDTEFGDNGTAAIGFAINFNNEGLEEKIFTFMVIFKKTGSKIRFNIDDENEFVNTDEGINDFCNYFFKTSEEDLTNRLSSFLRSPNTPIGFKVGIGQNKTTKS